MAKKRITFTLDEDLIKELKERSEKTDVPQAKIVTRALESYLKKNK